MWELDYKESWAPKNWCFWTVVLEKTLESPLNSKEIQPVLPKWNQPWIFIGRTDAEAEVVTLWPPNVKSWLIGKDPDGGKDWGQEEKGMTEDEMVGWCHWLNGHEFEQTPGDSEGQRRLASYNPRSCKELDTTEQLNGNNKPGSCQISCTVCKDPLCPVSSLIWWLSCAFRLWSSITGTNGRCPPQSKTYKLGSTKKTQNVKAVI